MPLSTRAQPPLSSNLTTTTGRSHPASTPVPTTQRATTQRTGRTAASPPHGPHRLRYRDRWPRSAGFRRRRRGQQRARPAGACHASLAARPHMPMRGPTHRDGAWLSLPWPISGLRTRSGTRTGLRPTPDPRVTAHPQFRSMRRPASSDRGPGKSCQSSIRRGRDVTVAYPPGGASRRVRGQARTPRPLTRSGTRRRSWQPIPAPPRVRARGRS
jgi:hypothetical protein